MPAIWQLEDCQHPHTQSACDRYGVHISCAEFPAKLLETETMDDSRDLNSPVLRSLQATER